MISSHNWRTYCNTQQALDSLNQEIVEASERLNRQYASIAPTISDVEIARSYCNAGILLGEINRDAVIKVCDKAVELASLFDKGLYTDSRGIAKAQADDLVGALEDFKFAQTYYKNFAGNCIEVIDLRTQWISDLEQGINPFDDPTTIDVWLNEPSLNECDPS